MNTAWLRGTVKPRLARIRIYPIKSLDPLELQEASVNDGAGLCGDREFALFRSGDGALLNAKRLGERITSIRARYEWPDRQVELRVGDRSVRFAIDRQRTDLEAWLEARLGHPVTLRRNERTGFPDDTEASGPTVVGTASLESVAAWFAMEVEEVRRRFRANLEIAGLSPFEEDRLFGLPGKPRRFRIGAVEMLGTNPCARCIVPSMDSHGRAVPDPRFARKFAALRKRHAWKESEIGGYEHFYRFTVNTRVCPEQGANVLRVGDAVRMSAP